MTKKDHRPTNEHASNRCAKKTEAAKAAQQSRGIGLAGQASANAASDMASGTNRVVLGHGR